LRHGNLKNSEYDFATKIREVRNNKNRNFNKKERRGKSKKRKKRKTKKKDMKRE
jgi:hypothetical protein